MIRINKENAKISNWDKVYIELLENILLEGKTSKKDDIDTISLEGVNIKLKNIENNFPILESKNVPMKDIVSELLWIYQEQSNDVRWLEARDNNTWKDYKIDEDGIYRIYEKEGNFEDKEVEVVLPNNMPHLDPYGDEIYAISKEEGKTIKKAIYFGKEWANTIGTAYGWINYKYRNTQKVLINLKENYTDNNNIINLWQDKYIYTGTIAPNDYSLEWKVSKDELNLYVHQRNTDVFNNFPKDISKYATLLKMFAKVSNLSAGSLNYSIMDAYIKENDLEKVAEYMDTFDRMKETEDFISKSTYNQIWKKYYDLLTKKNDLEKYTQNNPNNKEALLGYRNILDELMTLEFMLKKEKPILNLANKENFFEYSNDVMVNEEYLKENPTGNYDIKLLNYTSL